MSVDSLEKSVQDSQPFELYDFETASQAWRYTTARSDVVFAGQRYTHLAITRTATASTTTAEAPQFYVTVPFDADVVRRNVFSKLPPGELTLEIWRQQSGAYVPYWSGDITSISIEGRKAKMLCPGLLGSALSTQVPSIVYSQFCQHALYDSRCTVAKSAHVWNTLVSTYLNSDHSQISVASVNFVADEFYRGGVVQRFADGEQRLIMDQVGNNLTLDAPFPDLNLSDQIALYAGCNHTIFDCRDKYANVANFGGTPFIPSLNMFLGQMRSKV